MVVRVVHSDHDYDALPDVPGPLVHSQPLFNELKIVAIFELFTVQNSKFVFGCLRWHTLVIRLKS